MEPITIFALAVAFIGVFHMLSTAVDKFSRGRVHSTKQTKVNRSDWYCFFNITDLIGSDETPFEDGDQQQIDKRNEELLRQRRQQEARRPRLNV